MLSWKTDTGFRWQAGCRMAGYRQWFLHCMDSMTTEMPSAMLANICPVMVSLPMPMINADLAQLCRPVSGRAPDVCSGMVYFREATRFTVSCPLNYKWYPFDIQVKN